MRILWILPLLIVQGAFAKLPPKADLDRYIEEAVLEWKVPGLAISVVQGDRVYFQKGYGLTVLGAGKAVEPSTRFPIGSCTKAFTAALLAHAVDSGKMEWTTPVKELLPSFRLHDPYASYVLRVADLLSHQIGLPDHAGDLLYFQLPYENLSEKMRFIQPASSFRDVFSYQNLSYVALGEILERVEGKPWEHLVQEDIFLALGMDRSQTRVRELRSDRFAAMPHMKVEGSTYVIPWRDEVEFGPAGSIVSTAEDMSLWMRYLLGVRQGSVKKSPLSLRPLYQPLIYLPQHDWVKVLYPKHCRLAYGLGWFLYSHHGSPVVEHAGNLPGVTVKLALMPEEGIGVFVACNQHQSLLPHALIMWIFDSYVNRRTRDWSRYLIYLKERGEEIQREDDVLPQAPSWVEPLPIAKLQEFEGSYYHSVYGKAKLLYRGSNLELSLGPRLVAELNDFGAGRYFATWKQIVPKFFPANGFLQFYRDPRGVVSGFRLQGVGYYSRSSSRS